MMPPADTTIPSIVSKERKGRSEIHETVTKMPLYFDFCVYCGLKTCPSNDYYQLYLRSLVCSPSVMAPPHCLCRTIHCKSYHDDDDEDDDDYDDNYDDVDDDDEGLF